MNSILNFSPDEQGLIARAWPDGMHPDDEVLLRRLPERRRAKAMARLKALVRIEEARRGSSRAHVDMKQIARDAGLTPDGLFSIRRKWAQDRRLASVVPYLERAERQPTQRDDDDPVVVAARSLIVERPGNTDSALASELKRTFSLSAPVLMRLVRRLRRDDATDPTRVREVFGRSLLIDLCAIDRVTPGRDPRPMLCAVVVERASGMILGHALAAAGDDTLSAQAAAARAARARLASERFDLAEGLAEVELTLGDGPNDAAAFASAQMLKAEGVDLRVNSSGPRRYGQRLVSLLGKRLGRLWWRPRSSSPVASPPPGDLGSVMTLADAEVLVAAEVAAHNGDVVARLAEGGVVPGWGVAEGAMGRALARAISVLEASLV